MLLPSFFAGEAHFLPLLLPPPHLLSKDGHISADTEELLPISSLSFLTIRPTQHTHARTHTHTHTHTGLKGCVMYERGVELHADKHDSLSHVCLLNVSVNRSLQV